MTSALAGIRRAFRLRSKGPVVTAVLLLLAALPVREAALLLARDRPQGTPIDAALAPLARALPPAGEVAWVSDAPSEHDALAARVRLQFALAPRVVVETTARIAAVVAWAPDAERLERLLSQHGLRAVARWDSGYALCAREGP